MRVFGTLLGLWAATSVWSAHPAAALTEQEICARALETYGVRPPHCLTASVPVDPADTAPPALPAATTQGGLRAEILESHIFFEGGGTELDDDAIVQLAVLIDVLQSPLMRSACLRLIGHSDSTGSATSNRVLAQKRAEVVADAIASGLSDNGRVLEVISEGESRPLSGVPDNSVVNRRVEIQTRTCP